MKSKALNNAGADISLRERKKLATRQALSSAALRLAVERGLNHLRVEDIAEAADVSPRTFNNYFANKYEAICYSGIDRTKQIGATLRDQPVGKPLWNAVTDSVLQQFAGTDEVPSRDWMASLHLVLSSAELQGEYLKVTAAMRESLAEAVADRINTDLEQDMFPRILAGVVIAASQAAIVQWYKADPPTPLLPLVRSALEQLATICSCSTP